MDCRECRQKLNEYLDGELSAGEAHEVEEHTSRCDRCRREMEELRRTIEAVRDLPRHRAPGGMADEVTEEVRSSRGQGRLLKLWMPAGVAAAAAVLVAIFVLPHLMNGPPPSGGVKRAPQSMEELEDRGAPRPGAPRTATKQAAPEGRELSAKREEEVVVLRTRDPAALRERIQEALGDRMVETGKNGEARDEPSRGVVLRVTQQQRSAIVRRLRRLARREKPREQEKGKAGRASSAMQRESVQSAREAEKESEQRRMDEDTAGPPGPEAAAEEAEKEKKQAAENVTYIRVRIIPADAGSEAKEK